MTDLELAQAAEAAIKALEKAMAEAAPRVEEKLDAKGRAAFKRLTKKAEAFHGDAQEFIDVYVPDLSANFGGK